MEPIVIIIVRGQQGFDLRSQINPIQKKQLMTIGGKEGKSIARNGC